ncbi:hypothetical protein ACIBEJ_34455 [Nonomuraea sp. NPDC050790]|uniref:hypothetical protein n=1 Tax=Nonomuraea sp. NPDC050790 TaxID=3364371 RepID=UPI003791FDF8
MTSTKGRKCDGKRRHAGRQDAERARGRLIEKGANPNWLKAYACKHCGGFHVGHVPGRRKR